MKFKNDTDENIKYRLGDYKEGFRWNTARPGEIVDIPLESGKNTKLTLLETAKEDPKVIELTEEEYFKKLVALKGVGKKSAEDIVEKYPTETELLQAISSNEEIHKRDDIDEIVKKEYK